jgi:hypothetical protein
MMLAAGYASCFALATSDAGPKALLLRCMQNTLNVNVRAVVSQRTSEGKERRQIEVEQTRSGKSRRTVILPIEEQGTEFVDDGLRCSKYCPDTGKVEIVDSHRSGTGSGEFAPQTLAILAGLNYSLQSGAPAKVAGRPATVVTATPLHKELPKRRFFIDSQTAYLLRLETTDEDGRFSIRFDTLSVVYPPMIQEPRVDPRILAAGQTSFAAAGVKRLRFNPVMPRKLPLGFVCVCAEPFCKDGGSIAVRFTDGIIRGSVYEWRPSAGETAPGLDSEWADNGGIRFLVLVEAPSQVRRQILQAFLSEPPTRLSAQMAPPTSARGTEFVHPVVQNQ